MHRDGRPEVESPHLLGLLLRRSLPWPLLAAVSCVVGFGISGQSGELLGALLGLAVVVAFYGVDLVVLRLTRGSAPEVTTSALLAEYVAKVLLLAAMLWSLHDSAVVDLQATAVTVVVTTVVWVGAVTVAALRTRSFVLDPVNPRAEGPPDKASVEG